MVSKSSVKKCPLSNLDWSPVCTPTAISVRSNQLERTASCLAPFTSVVESAIPCPCPFCTSAAKPVALNAHPIVPNTNALMNTFLLMTYTLPSFCIRNKTTQHCPFFTFISWLIHLHYRYACFCSQYKAL